MSRPIDFGDVKEHEKDTQKPKQVIEVPSPNMTCSALKGSMKVPSPTSYMVLRKGSMHPAMVGRIQG